MLDVDALSEMMAGIISEEVEKVVAPLNARIAELEKREPVAGPPGEKGDPGENGSDGTDGKDGASIAAEDIAPLIAGEVAKAIAEIPAPQDGKDGADGNDGREGSDGKDGRGVKELLIDRAGHLVATMDDGELKTLGPVIGKDGQDGAVGKDGRDGFSLEDFDAKVLEDDRTIELKFVSGEHEHVATLKWPTAIYRGVFNEGQEYERGDMVTWAGATWHCDTPTKDKPGTENWTLAVKKGRDGKDAKHG